MNFIAKLRIVTDRGNGGYVWSLVLRASRSLSRAARFLRLQFGLSGLAPTPKDIAFPLFRCIRTCGGLRKARMPTGSTD